MPPAPDNGAEVASGWVRLAQVVKHHPLMMVVSVLGTLATFTVGTARVVGLVVDAETAPIGETIPASELMPPSAASYAFVEVSDATGQISVEVPRAWATCSATAGTRRVFLRFGTVT